MVLGCLTTLITLLKTELVRLDNYYQRLFEASNMLDSLNVRILGCMANVGPRNLLEVSRRTRIPFTTVYHRVNRLEKRVRRVAQLLPSYSKLGLTCLVVIAKARPATEEQLANGLKLPNYWSSVTRCEGGFTHHSVQCVPVEYLTGFDRYLRQLLRNGLVDNLQVVRVGDIIPLNLNFQYYNVTDRTWSFTWDRWFEKLIQLKTIKRIDDPVSYARVTDKHDLFIVKELQKNARTRLAGLARMMGLTLPGVKYHYDRMVARGVCKHFWIEVFPCPIEVSAVYDIMLDFPSRESMNKFFSFLNSLFFFIDVTKVVGKNSLLVRAHIPEMQVSNMFQFLSQLASRRALTSYSALRLRFETRASQTISYELFDEKKGWIFDSAKCAAELKRICA
jgi:DNA-binding Lrp family transcriptional regulator